MSLLLTAAPIDEVSKVTTNREKPSKNSKDVRAMNAIMNNPVLSDKSTSQSASFKPSPNMVNNAGSALADFRPQPSTQCNPKEVPAPPAGMNPTVSSPPSAGRPVQPVESNSNDAALTVEGFQNLTPDFNSDYYKRLVPLYTSAAGSESSGEPNELLRKLNQIIHMLEEQSDSRTGSVNEELILYCFLGIFTIFLVDSFARAGKYTR